MEHGRFTRVEAVIVEGFELDEKVVGLTDWQGLTCLNPRQGDGRQGRRRAVDDESDAWDDVRLVLSEAREVIHAQLQIKEARADTRHKKVEREFAVCTGAGHPHVVIVTEGHIKSTCRRRRFVFENSTRPVTLRA